MEVFTFSLSSETRCHRSSNSELSAASFPVFWAMFSFSRRRLVLNLSMIPPLPPFGSTPPARVDAATSSHHHQR